MTQKYSTQEMYDALVRKDPSYEGSFIAGVKTTGIFCRPTCTARKPKAENVEFYKNCEEAILHGYRPCKVCKPLEKQDETPVYIRDILKEIKKDPFVRIKDYHLRERGIEPSKIRRWFKQHHNMTFHAFQRMMRINHAYTSIHSGEKVTDSAFDSGYESLSGFNDRFQSLFGLAPSQAKDKKVINIMRLTTPIGPMYCCATEKGICMLEYTDRKMLETEFKDLCKRLNAVILPGPNKHFELLQQELGQYFEGKLQNFTVPLDTPGTEFQQKVWKALIEVPYGTTRSYKNQAILLNKPTAVRAVANSNGQNRISIIIPCHRIIGTNGELRGYGGGLSRKRWLLDFEAGSGKK